MAIKYEAAINAMDEARKAEREYVIDRVLEIIDKYAWYDKFPSFLAMEMAQVIKDEVKALKGGQDEQNAVR